MPRLLASRSLRDIAFMRHPMKMSTMQQIAMTGSAIIKESTETFPRLPICQNVISTSSVSGVAMYLMKPSTELRNPPTIMPDSTRANVVLLRIRAGRSMHNATAMMPPANAMDICVT